MRVPAGYAARACTWEDLGAVAGLIRAADLVDVGFADPVRDHVEAGWRMPGYDLARDSVAIEWNGSVVAQASVEGVNPDHALDVFGRVHPEHRARGLGAALLDWSERRALERSPSLEFLRSGVPTGDDGALQLLEARGFAIARTFWHMRRSLDGPVGEPPAIQGLIVRGYEPADLRPVFDVLEDAFSDHWAFEPYPFEAYVEEVGRTPPTLIAVADSPSDGVVGAALGRLIEGEGWLDVVGVRRSWRGRGVARALLLRVFGGLRDAGAASVTLNVDSENDTGATSLYERIGMRARRSWTVFEKRFPDATAG